ncbi:39059_t:CDS:2 [Gigaspora margarita]|uniref:39059_t:CDS:1 n=1 Tax=Gigaspora margarita TaxID=4874 RepID=A0ABM8W413_GIGMA|nr:39059_t:CDS:2 [Gigaspora margarita]
MTSLANFNQFSLINQVRIALKFVNINLNFLSTNKNDIIYLIGTHQNNLILVNCDEKTDTVTAGQVKEFQSEVSRYLGNTLGIYVAKKASINSLKLAKSSQNIIVTNLIELNNAVSSYFELKKNSEQMCELMMRRIDELSNKFESFETLFLKLFVVLLMPFVVLVFFLMATATGV